MAEKKYECSCQPITTEAIKYEQQHDIRLQQKSETMGYLLLFQEIGEDPKNIEKLMEECRPLMFLA